MSLWQSVYKTVNTQKYHVKRMIIKKKIPNNNSGINPNVRSNERTQFTAIMHEYGMNHVS